jgi:Apea-like HEPN
LHPEFMEALSDDSRLNIFAPPNEPFITSTSGYGELIQTGRLPGLLIASASLAHDAKGKSKEDLEGFLNEVEETLQAFRGLIAGEEVTAITLVAFDGLTVRSGNRVETPWGWLRAATEMEEATTPMNLTPTVVLVMERPTRFVIGEGLDEEGLEAAPRHARVPIERLQLAALLGIEREDRITLGRVWSIPVEPVLFSGFGVALPTGPRASDAMFFGRGGPARTGGEVLTEEEERQLQEWATLVERHYDPAIEVATRRTISALLERDEAEDALIDAVIALENLFGSANATGEVVFRVTTAAAHLLEPDPAKRTAKRKKLGKIYDTRSKVIHGVAITEKMKLPERKEEAIEAAVGSLRAFFAEQPHLIADRDRGLRLILGTAGENPGVIASQ